MNNDFILHGEDALRFKREMTNPSLEMTERREAFLQGVDVRYEDNGEMIISCDDLDLSFMDKLSYQIEFECKLVFNEPVLYYNHVSIETKALFINRINSYVEMKKELIYKNTEREYYQEGNCCLQAIA